MRPPRSIPLWAIIGGSLFLGYLAYFIAPVFLNKEGGMVFPRYVPTMNPIGVDLRLAYDFSKGWFSGAPVPIGWIYPPLERVLRLPLLIVSFPCAYAIQTVASIFAFLSVLMALPLLVCKRADRTALALVAMAGLLSYGFQFELERGQSNVIAVALVAWALVLFHRSSKRGTRLLAYLLFSCAIQLKLYPAVFVLGFTQDARDWRRNLIRWSALGVANVIGLFALGMSNFQAFLASLTTAVGNSANIFNHSITSFAGMTQKLADGYTPLKYHPTEVAGLAMQVQSGIPAIWQHSVGRIVETGSLIVLATCFGLVLAFVAWRHARSNFKYMMIMCALSAMLLPMLSFDYKLSILIMAFAFFVGESDVFVLDGWTGTLQASLFATVSLLLVLTLFPPEFKPIFLRSSTPMLLGMVVGFTLLMVAENAKCGQRRHLDACPDNVP